MRPKLAQVLRVPPPLQWTCGKAQALPVMAAFPWVCCHYPPGHGRPSLCRAETVSQSIMCRILIRLHLHCFCRSPPGPLFTVCQRHRLKRTDIIHGGNARRRTCSSSLDGEAKGWGVLFRNHDHCTAVYPQCWASDVAPTCRIAFGPFKQNNSECTRLVSRCWK